MHNDPALGTEQNVTMMYRHIIESIIVTNKGSQTLWDVAGVQAFS